MGRLKGRLEKHDRRGYKRWQEKMQRVGATWGSDTKVSPTGFQSRYVFVF